MELREMEMKMMMIRNFYCVKLHKTAVVKWKIIIFCVREFWCFCWIFVKMEKLLGKFYG